MRRIHGDEYVKEKENISASEISEYLFCNVSWYLDQEGAPRSQHSSARMNAGVKSHATVKRRYRTSEVAVYLTAGILVITVVFILYYAMTLII